MSLITQLSDLKKLNEVLTNNILFGTNEPLPEGLLNNPIFSAIPQGGAEPNYIDLDITISDNTGGAFGEVITCFGLLLPIDEFFNPIKEDDRFIPNSISFEIPNLNTNVLTKFDEAQQDYRIIVTVVFLDENGTNLKYNALSIRYQNGQWLFFEEVQYLEWNKTININ